MKSGSRIRRTVRRVTGGLAIACIVACAPACRPAAQPVAEQTPSPTPAAGIFVTEVRGRVERFADGAWRDLVAGDALKQEDRIRTGADSGATLKVDESLVFIDPETELSVAELSSTVSRLRLDDGRIRADLGDTSRGLQVGFKDSDATAEATTGAFALANQDGTVAVSATRGTVRLASKGKSVEIGAGEQSFALKGLPPAAPEKISAELFVKLGRPPTLQREKTTRIAGEATPGAFVNVNGVRTVAGLDGTFVAMVPLKEGANPVTVLVKTADGRVQRESLPPIVVDSKPIKVESTVEWK